MIPMEGRVAGSSPRMEKYQGRLRTRLQATSAGLQELSMLREAQKALVERTMGRVPTKTCKPSENGDVETIKPEGCTPVESPAPTQQYSNAATKLSQPGYHSNDTTSGQRTPDKADKECVNGATGTCIESETPSSFISFPNKTLNSEKQVNRVQSAPTKENNDIPDLRTTTDKISDESTQGIHAHDANRKDPSFSTPTSISNQFTQPAKLTGTGLAYDFPSPMHAVLIQYDKPVVTDSTVAAEENRVTSKKEHLGLTLPRTPRQQHTAGKQQPPAEDEDVTTTRFIQKLVRRSSSFKKLQEIRDRKLQMKENRKPEVEEHPEGESASVEKRTEMAKDVQEPMDSTDVPSSASNPDAKKSRTADTSSSPMKSKPILPSPFSLRQFIEPKQKVRNLASSPLKTNGEPWAVIQSSSLPLKLKSNQFESWEPRVELTRQRRRSLNREAVASAPVTPDIFQVSGGSKPKKFRIKQFELTRQKSPNNSSTSTIPSPQNLNSSRVNEKHKSAEFQRPAVNEDVRRQKIDGRSSREVGRSPRNSLPPVDPYCLPPVGLCLLQDAHSTPPGGPPPNEMPPPRNVYTPNGVRKSRDMHPRRSANDERPRSRSLSHLSMTSSDAGYFSYPNSPQGSLKLDSRHKSRVSRVIGDPSSSPIGKPRDSRDTRDRSRGRAVEDVAESMVTPTAGSQGTVNSVSRPNRRTIFDQTNGSTPKRLQQQETPTTNCKRSHSFSGASSLPLSVSPWQHIERSHSTASLNRPITRQQDSNNHGRVLVEKPRMRMTLSFAAFVSDVQDTFI